MILTLKEKLFILDKFRDKIENEKNIYKQRAYNAAIMSISHGDMVSLTPGMNEKIKLYLDSSYQESPLYKVHTGMVTRNKAGKVLDYVLRKIKKYVTKIDIVGSYSRGNLYMHDVDILVMLSTNKNLKTMIEKAFDETEIKVIRLGDYTCSFMYNDVQVDITVVKTEREYPFMLLHYEGPKERNIMLRKRALRMGYKLNQYGLYKKNSKELVRTFTNKMDIIKFLTI